MISYFKFYYLCKYLGFTFVELSDVCSILSLAGLDLEQVICAVEHFKPLRNDKLKTIRDVYKVDVKLSEDFILSELINSGNFETAVKCAEKGYLRLPEVVQREVGPFRTYSHHLLIVQLTYCICLQMRI